MKTSAASYPFGALVGQESLRQALLLGAVDPSLGGVLIRGEKGTAKSTAARALARLLPPIPISPGCPYRCDPAHPWPDCPTCAADHPAHHQIEVPTPHVDLPLGATEDRVLGTLDLQRMLQDGQATLRPGLLAEAHRGILYVDEINLLADHLVDSLLDVAASGINSVQRDGVAARHPARFLLVGSMNPEEGELRPQLLDRFGLTVEVAAPMDFALRAEVVRRRLAFEADPTAFAATWASADGDLGKQVAAARARLGTVVVPDGLLTAIARLCVEAQVDGLRADIALYKAARALAALEGRSTVRRADLRTAAEYVLPHRRRRQPFQQPGLDHDALDRALGPDDPDEPTESPPPPPPEIPNEANPDGPADETDSAELDSPAGDGAEPSGGDTVHQPSGPVSMPRLEVDPTTRSRSAPPGKHAVRATASRGTFLRAVAEEAPRELAVDATIRAAVRRGAGTGLIPPLERGDLHGKQRAAAVSTLILFVVDTSGSMGARRRMEVVKAAVLQLLVDAYQRRDRVAAIAFRGPQAEFVLTPTRSVDQADAALRQLPTGGRTPLAHALTLAGEVVATANQTGPTLVVVLTDGRANVPLPGGETGDPWPQALAAAEAIAALGASAVVFDTEEGFGRVGRAAELAAALRADCFPLTAFSAEAVHSQVAAPSAPVGRA